MVTGWARTALINLLFAALLVLKFSHLDDLNLQSPSFWRDDSCCSPSFGDNRIAGGCSSGSALRSTYPSTAHSWEGLGKIGNQLYSLVRSCVWVKQWDVMFFYGLKKRAKSGQVGFFKKGSLKKEGQIWRNLEEQTKTTSFFRPLLNFFVLQRETYIIIPSEFIGWVMQGHL